MTIPNYISIFRLMLVPVFVISLLDYADPGTKLSWWTSVAVWLRSKRGGYGSMPRAISRSSLAWRLRSSSSPRCGIRLPVGLSVGSLSGSPLAAGPVTGGGAEGEGIGNGRAACILLARAGCRVLVVDRQPDPAARTVEMIAAEGGEAAAFKADVTTADDCAAMVAAADRRWSRLDVLVNNVGIGSRGSVVDEPIEAFARVMRVNVESMVLASKYAIPSMIASGRGGAIVNISSISALRPRGLTSYSTSKGAVIALTRAMAADHGRDGIRVNCVCPGDIDTPMLESEADDLGAPRAEFLSAAAARPSGTHGLRCTHTACARCDSRAQPAIGWYRRRRRDRRRRGARRQRARLIKPF